MAGRAYTLKITLLETEPPIWRRLVVPDDITLDRLHQVLQVTMGWTDSHLHQFLAEDREWRYSDPSFEIENAGDESDVTLEEVAPRKGSRFIYSYDFGDDWQHLVTVESQTPAQDLPAPHCLAGERACPPEDVGGVFGYEEFLQARADPGHEEHAMYSEWMPENYDPGHFSAEEVNRTLTRLELEGEPPEYPDLE